ncbi:hypothetical protein Q9L42_010120 [Methylomarinum sp. Ch1-1]|uniref:Uncharacterized protein n=1 Tax=Methylomarinum roseum TaxID=3067653 RepID=A0AAU7NZM8_9GAMM|nr:hypothetical protein [Methylomarinum sp. Ch1-1]MDP4521397.1 hypothetical protein [Methylomarinum sp. Ch1-1]
MSFVAYLAIYLVICIIATYLTTRLLAMSQPLPDRRKYDRRKNVRPGHIDRRASYRRQNNLAINRRFADDQLS